MAGRLSRWPLKSLAASADLLEWQGGRSMRRIAIACLKGGSSKSTTATSLAVGLARRGERVLLVDVDAQSNATWLLTGGQGAESPTLAEVLMRQAGAVEAIRPSVVPGLDLLPATSALGPVNVALAQELSRDTRLRSALAPIDDAYDVTIADTGPTFTTLLANVLVWTSEVIIPADPGVFAVLGLVELQGVMAEVREAYGNADLRLAGLVLTRVGRSNVHRDVEKELEAGSATWSIGRRSRCRRRWKRPIPGPRRSCSTRRSRRPRSPMTP